MLKLVSHIWIVNVNMTCSMICIRTLSRPVQMLQYPCCDGVNQQWVHYVGDLRLQCAVLLPVKVNGMVIIDCGAIECSSLFVMQGDGYNIVPPLQIKVQVEWFHNTKYKKSR